jgi:predicted enzyme related to lactoylglutathione lyase
MRIEVCIDCADPLGLARFWAGVVGGEVRGSGQPYSTIHGGGGRPELVFQRVPEAKAGKNRLHLDLYVDDPAAEVGRISALGARPVGGRVQGGDSCEWWQVMADPEGNEFCVCAGPPGGGSGSPADQSSCIPG